MGSRKRGKSGEENDLKERLIGLCGANSKSLIYHQLAGKDAVSKDVSVGLVLEYASWNKSCLKNISSFTGFLSDLAEQVFQGFDCNIFHACIQVDENDDTVSHCIGDHCEISTSSAFLRPIPPSSFPAFALVLFDKTNLEWRYVPNVDSAELLQYLSRSTPLGSFPSSLYRAIKVSADRLADDLHVGVQPDATDDESLRIFIAGDRSSVGKSSVCLGLLGNLLAAGYSPDSLAYIKPATQSESTQLVQLYCDKHGITCVPIGPLVYYRGFTRAFLAGETETTDQLLLKVGQSVDRVARGKRVVLVDGVGFPAVGSICGTDNASVAKACSYPIIGNSADGLERKPMGVVLVGGSGVGAAVDAFNLNATYFEQASVPVMGAIFNKLDSSGFYSLENCRTQVSQYFNVNEKQQKLGRRPFGFVPLVPEIAGSDAMKYVDEYIRLFGAHVDVASIIQAARQVRHDSGIAPAIAFVSTSGMHGSKRQKVDPVPRNKLRDRNEIEMNAITAGAAPSA